MKSPKIFWSDPGLALFLAGREPTGADFENIIFADLATWSASQFDRPQILYWRTRGGEEVDFVVETKSGLLAVEAKSSRTVGPRDAAGLRAFRDEYPDLFLGGLLLHDGDTVEALSERIIAAPWHAVI